MIHFKIYPTHFLIQDDLILKDKNVVIIDVLRATTTILTALVNGAKEVIPAENPTTAARISKGRGKNALLCGERGGKKVEGFDLGNSPFEYQESKIKDKTLVFSTTNGSVTIVKSRFAKNSVLASFLNISAIVEYIKQLNEDIILICSGKINNFCLEDYVCAGMILRMLIKNKTEDLNYYFEDAEIAAKLIAKYYGMEFGKPSVQKIQEMYKLSEHGKFLESLGFESDLEYCSGIDSFNKIPMYKNGVIKFIENFDTVNNSKLKKITLNKN
jgi:2-phosphosulfolactate phosphatase